MQPATSNQPPRGFLSRLVGSIFFIIFGAFGLFFLALMGREFLRILDSRSWAPAQCRILSASVQETGDDDKPYNLAVSYQYEVGGRIYENSEPNFKSSSNITEINSTKAKYQPQSVAPCSVNPKNPAQAQLEQRSMWFMLFAIIPLVFVAIGAAGVIGMWKTPKQSSRAIAAKGRTVKQAGTGTLALRVLGLVFLIAGVLLAYFLSVRPIQRMLDSREWNSTNCEVISSEVRYHSGDSDSGPTYSIDIRYRYTIGGQVYESNRYHFMSGSSSGYEGKKAVVRQYPTGKRFTCFVDPRDPNSAVISRDFHWSYLIGLIGVIFAAVGFFMLFKGPSRTTASKAPSASDRTSFSPAVRTSAISEPLKSNAGPKARFIGITFVAIFWNGIISVFAWQAYQQWIKGDPEWFLMIFLIPFVLVGLGLIVGIVYSFLALFNPRVSLLLDTPSLRLGEATRIRWKFEGRIDKLTGVKIILKATEHISYRRGTRTHREQSCFLEQTVFESQISSQIASGQVSLRIPQDSMHSFSGESNQVTWRVIVQGEIPNWPDVKEEYELEVLPMKHTEF